MTQPAKQSTQSAPAVHQLLHNLKTAIYGLAEEARANRISIAEGAALRHRVKEIFQLTEYVDPKGLDLVLLEVPVGVLNRGWQQVKSTLQADAAEIQSLQAQINAGGGGGTTLTPIQQQAVGLITDSDDVSAAQEIAAQDPTAGDGAGGTTPGAGAGTPPPTGV